MRFCPLFSGSSGNALFLEAGNIRLLIDCGLPGRTVEQALAAIHVDPSALDAILVTHEHSDHVKGVGVFSRKYDLPIYANAACWQAMTPQLGNIALKNIRVFETNQDFYLGQLNILPFSTPHDAADPVGYAFSANGRKVCTMTDIGHMHPGLLDAAKGADLLLLEANHDIDLLQRGPYPYHLKQRILSRHGHLSNADAAKALVKLHTEGVHNVILGHMSRENNTDALVRSTIREALLQEGCLNDMHLALARRDGPTGIFCID